MLDVTLTAAAAGVSCSGEKVFVVNPKRMVVAIVALRGPTSWFGAVLDPASVGMTDDRFVNNGVTIATVLSAGENLVPGMGFIIGGPPGLQVSGFDAPKIASSKYATREPAVRPIL